MPDAQTALFARAAAIARGRLLTDKSPLRDPLCVHRVRQELHCWKCVKNWQRREGK